MEVTYRPLLASTQYCPCDWSSNTTELTTLSHSKKTSPFFRSLFAPFAPLWVNPDPPTSDNSPDVSTPSGQADVNYRAIFERQKKLAMRTWDFTALNASVYIPRGRWLWTHQVPFEDRREQVFISRSRRYTLSMKTAKIYQETITYIRKLWTREHQREGFAREVMLHKTLLRPLQGALVPTLIGLHTNLDGVQMTYDIPHHSFWIQASPDMPDVLKRRCLEAYSQLHAQGVLHGSVELENILIGGDGRVKIMNFDQSRSTLADDRVQLHQATVNDFKLEMREVHYKLDYMQARKKERMVWDNRDDLKAIELPTGDTSKIHSRPPYTVLLDPPVDPAKWTLPDFWKPNRFVVPGQSVQQFEYHLRQFLSRIDEEAGEGLNPPRSKKRKYREHDEGNTEEPRSSKRVRFLAVTWLDDGTTREMRSPPPPGVRRVVPRISRDDTGDISGHSLDPVPKDIGANSTGYPRSLPNSCPSLSLMFNHQEFISSWQSARDRRFDHGDDGTNDSMGDNEVLSERARGKRRRVDLSKDPPQDGPRVKRLRRSETTILGSFDLEDNGNSGSASISHPPLAHPSSMQTQASQRPIVDLSRSSSNSSIETDGLPHPSGTVGPVLQPTDIASIPSPPPSTSSSGGRSTIGSPPPSTNYLPSARRRLRLRTAGIIKPSPILDSIDQSSSHTDSTAASLSQIIPSISDRSNFVFSFSSSTSAPRLTSQSRDAMNELISATAVVNASREAQSSRGSLGPIVILYDPSLAVSQPPPPRSMSDTAQSITGQLPSTIRTVASTIARSFGLGMW